MQTVFVALEDPALRDQVKTCIRNFDNLRAVAVPPDRLLDLLREEHHASALIVEFKGTGSKAEFDKSLTVLVLGKRTQRERSHRIRMHQDIYSFIPVPLDPFDLARRLARLAEDLAPQQT